MNPDGITAVMPLPPPHCNACRIAVWKDMTGVCADPDEWRWYCTRCRTYFTPTPEDQHRYRQGNGRWCGGDPARVPGDRR